MCSVCMGIRGCEVEWFKVVVVKGEARRRFSLGQGKGHCRLVLPG